MLSLIHLLIPRHDMARPWETHFGRLMCSQKCTSKLIVFHGGDGAVAHSIHDSEAMRAAYNKLVYNDVLIDLPNALSPPSWLETIFSVCGHVTAIKSTVRLRGRRFITTDAVVLPQSFIGSL